MITIKIDTSIPIPVKEKQEHHNYQEWKKFFDSLKPGDSFKVSAKHAQSVVNWARQLDQKLVRQNGEVRFWKA